MNNYNPLDSDLEVEGEVEDLYYCSKLYSITPLIVGGVGVACIALDPAGLIDDVNQRWVYGIVTTVLTSLIICQCGWRKKSN